MKKSIFKVGIFLFVMAVVGVVSAYALGSMEIHSIHDLLTLLSPPSLGGMLMAGGIVPGAIVSDGAGNTSVPVTVGNLEAAGLVDPDLERDIAFFNPDRYPLDTITRNYARKRNRAKAQKIQYPQMGYKPMADTLDATATGTGLTLASPCSSFTASVSNQATKVYIKPLNPEVWRQHDTLLMRDLTLNGTKENSVITDTSTYKDDIQFWVSKKDGDYLELVPTNGMKGTAANATKLIVPSFTATTRIFRMGQAKSELAMTTAPFASNPQLFDQYCQNFMAQIEESTFAAITDKKVDINFTDYEAENIYSMRGEMESSFLWGARHEIKDGNDTILFTGGITRSIDKVLDYGKGGGDHSLTKEQYTAWMSSLFTGNCGSKERVLFAGADLVSAIELLRETVKNINVNSSMETYLGVKCTSIVSTFGTLKIVHAPLLDEMGRKDYGYAIDLEHLYKKEFVPMTATEIDLKDSGQKNATAKMIQEVSCMILRYPDCHAVIKPIA